MGIRIKYKPQGFHIPIWNKAPFDTIKTGGGGDGNKLKEAISDPEQKKRLLDEK